MYTKPYKISKELVRDAWEEVKSNRGSHGVDGETITKYEDKLGRNLYKLWRSGPRKVHR
jgi:retron-type reverse transcriptase